MYSCLLLAGRTFPDHKYYKDALGVGQLSLFNLLKAYSILDPELGYCQGLGFICAVLLLHVSCPFMLSFRAISLLPSNPLLPFLHTTRSSKKPMHLNCSSISCSGGSCVPNICRT